MIRLTWRQFRTQAWVAIAALAAIAITFLVTRPSLSNMYSASGIAACQARNDCGRLAASFINQVRADAAYPVLYAVGVIVVFLVPAIIGMFWGAPLIARELEDRTYRLAWTQSVTRTRWLTVKLGLLGLAAMAITGLFSLIVTWWASPLDRAATLGSPILANRMMPLLFAGHGIVPIGYAAFAFALGATAGALTGRTVPAMAVTIVIFVAVQLIMLNFVRPHLIPPAHATLAVSPGAAYWRPVGNGLLITGPATIPGAWVLSTSGHVYTGPAIQILKTCVNGPTSTPACGSAFASLHAQVLVAYQPASRYWALQWYETGIFLAAALALAGFCSWWIGWRRPGRIRPSSARPPRTASTLRASPAPPATSGHPGR
jgi:ABC-type transport system involved in multi-copper enzyme maturation permease subunit